MWIRVLLAGPLVVAAMLQHRPFWQQSAIMFLAFFGARLVELGVDTWRSAPARAHLALLAGLGLALGAVAALVAPLMAHEKRSALVFPAQPPHSAPPVDRPIQRAGTWKAVSINHHRACAIRDDATLWCWGHITASAEQHVDSPRPIPGLANVTAVSVGFASTCALVEGHAWCFGSNYAGEDGVPPIDSHDFRAEPVRVPITDDLVAVSVGTFHACALAVNGTVWCWGSNDKGQLGFAPGIQRTNLDAKPSEAVAPARVAIPPASAIAAGDGVSCAIGRDDGNVRCWGDIGLRNSMGDSDLAPPTVVDGLRAVTALAVGSGQICVLAEEASPTCWGDSADYDHAQRSVPGSRNLYAHDEAHGAIALGVGARHACAVLNNGETRCWGANYQGQLGNGRRDDDKHEPRGVRVEGVPAFVSVAAGELETCGLTATGELWCWGHAVTR